MKDPLATPKTYHRETSNRILEVTYEDMLNTVPPIKPILVGLNPCGTCLESKPGSITDLVARRRCVDGEDNRPLNGPHENETWMLR